MEASRQHGEQSGRGRREVTFPRQLSTSNPRPAEHPLSSPWQRRGPPFPGGRGECGRECETARGRERANKFSDNTVIQYGRHCVRERANGGCGSLLGRRVMINLGVRRRRRRQARFTGLMCVSVDRSQRSVCQGERFDSHVTNVSYTDSYVIPGAVKVG